jgi:hypothetical protein
MIEDLKKVPGVDTAKIEAKKDRLVFKEKPSPAHHLRRLPHLQRGRQPHRDRFSLRRLALNPLQ